MVSAESSVGGRVLMALERMDMILDSCSGAESLLREATSMVAAMVEDCVWWKVLLEDREVGAGDWRGDDDVV